MQSRSPAPEPTDVSSNVLTPPRDEPTTPPRETSAKLLKNPPGNLLAVSLKHRAGGLSLDLSFVLTQPWTILFGPSGSGKTSILRTIAGFVRPEAGEIVYGPETQVLLSTNKKLFLPPHRRPVRTAGQTARLFPHLSVQENILYGMSAPQSQGDFERTVLFEIMALMQLTTLANRRPDALSGGERQRVSVVRAVASAVTFESPERPLLLLDEPFAGLDTALRDDLAANLRAMLARWNIPVLSVSHDIAECYLLNAEIIRLGEGKLLDQGPARSVLALERERLLTLLAYTSELPRIKAES